MANVFLNRSAVVAFALMISTVSACSSSGGSSDSGSGGGADYSNDPASLLAQRDGASNVAAYSAALDAWQAKCKEGRVTDAGYVDATYQDEQKHNGPDPRGLP